MQKKVKLRHNEKGFMLLQAVTAIALSAIVSVGLMQKNIEDQSVSQAEIAGKLIHQYTSAVAEYTSDNNTTIAAGYNPVGVNWLRTAATCGAANGTGAKDYLPCSFPSTFSFGLTPNTLFTSLGGGKWSVTTTFGRILNGANIRMDLAEIAKKAAMGLGNEQATPLTSTTFHEYKVDYTAGVTEGTLLSVVNTNTSTDAWLRTDGSNRMNANLNVGGNDVVNARDGIYSRNVSAGNNLTAANNVIATNDVNAAGNITAGGSITAGTNLQATNAIITGFGGVQYKPDTTVVAGQACAPNGITKSDATGQILACINGRWKLSGGASGPIKEGDLASTFKNLSTEVGTWSCSVWNRRNGYYNTYTTTAYFATTTTTLYVRINKGRGWTGWISLGNIANPRAIPFDVYSSGLLYGVSIRIHSTGISLNIPPSISYILPGYGYHVCKLTGPRLLNWR